MKKYLLIVCALLCAGLSFGQEISNDSVKLIASSQLKKTETADRFAKRSEKSELKLLVSYLKERGYKSLNDDKNYFGSESVREFTKTRKKVKSFLYVQDYSNDKGEYASIGISGCDGDSATKPYYFLLFTPADGKFQNSTEYFVENGKVVLAHSWGTCLKNNIGGCAATCVVALVSCTGTTAAYLACLAVACGGCLAWELACCSCDCKWWCKGAVGCCDR